MLQDYKKFWESFGKFMKLGCIEDSGNQKRIAPLLRFHSSKNETDLISLDQYVENMPDSPRQDQVSFEKLDLPATFIAFTM